MDSAAIRQDGRSSWLCQNRSIARRFSRVHDWNQGGMEARDSDPYSPFPAPPSAAPYAMAFPDALPGGMARLVTLA